MIHPKRLVSPLKISWTSLAMIVIPEGASPEVTGDICIFRIYEKIAVKIHHRAPMDQSHTTDTILGLKNLKSYAVSSSRQLTLLVLICSIVRYRVSRIIPYVAVSIRSLKCLPFSQAAAFSDTTEVATLSFRKLWTQFLMTATKGNDNKYFLNAQNEGDRITS